MPDEEMSNTASPSHSSTPPPPHFTRFLDLPLEIQHQIWRECIAIPKFLHVHIYSAKSAAPQHPADPNSSPASPGWYRTKNELGNIVSSFPYKVHIPAHEAWRPAVFASVSRSARSIYHQIYRVRMPVRTIHGQRKLHLSPDFNVVWIIGDRPGIRDLQLMNFLYDVMAYDPRGIGIKHLALEGGHHGALSVLANRPSLGYYDKPLAESITEMLASSIETFYAVLMPGVNTKGLYQPSSYTCSQPRIPHSLTYQRVPCEPLPIYDEIKYTNRYIFFPSNLAQWTKFKESNDVKRQIPMRYLVSVSELLLDGHVMDDTFMRALELSSGMSNQHRDPIPVEPQNPVLTLAADTRSQNVPLLPVVGFWNFPADIFEAALNIERHDAAATPTERLSQDNTEFWILD